MINNSDKRLGRKPNVWKMAFFTLVGAILLTSGWLFWKVTGVNVDSGTKETTVVQKTEGISLNVSLDNAEISAVANEYLQASKEYAGYALEVTDSIALKGQAEIFGLPISFTLAGEPYATEEGNLQLKVDSISLGGLPLPRKESLAILADAIDFPDAISIEPEEETVIILLNTMQLPREMAIRLMNIDKQTKEYSLEVTIPVENLIE